ncbi:MAG TPA: carotenoid 1,2-hydratase [Burkholderiaceae bacterium]|nr:carotenoid 1,2-hydratase [Burkholderiaceae bacterium]
MITRRAVLTTTLAALPSALRAAALGVRPRELRFPEDHGSHPDTRTEWWYVTGRLDTDPWCGFQVTFFRSRTDVPADHPSRFAAHQLLFAHAALSDLSQRRLLHDQHIAREGFGIASAALGDARVKLRDWHMERRQGPQGSVWLAQAWSDTAGFALDLRCEATQPVLLQGEHGFSRKGPSPNQASHYYSEPQLQVSGRIVRKGRGQAVTGTAWLDHEWSETYMAPEAVGWDWVGMNLLDGSAFTAFRLRRRDGSTFWSSGSWRRAGGATEVFEGPAAIRFTPGRRWTSPATGTTYPVQWQVATPVGEFEIRALLDAQELDSRSSTGAIYWEGLSELLDARTARRVGLGYLEMTGYSSALRMA